MVEDVIRIDGVFYDAKRLAAIHPGGEIFVLIANNTDGTALFNSSHRRAFPHDKYKGYQMPAAKIASPSLFSAPPPTQKFDLYFELCERVKPLLPNGGFATTSYFVKVAAILTAFLALEVYFLVYGRTLLLSCLSGWVCALIGLNIQHDANHGAVSRNCKVNRLLGLTQDVIGGSALNWMIFHDTVHHVHCNDIDRDQDLNIPLMRLHTKVPWQIGYVAQQLYLWVLEALFGVVHVFTSAFYTLMGPPEHQKVLRPYFQTHQYMLLFNVVRVGLNFVRFPSWYTAQCVAATYMFGGLYLAFFFFISHNFQGVKKEGVNSTAGDWVRNQAETSSNVGGWLLAVFNGGLNYQIEHHLFPRVHHSNYHRLSPVVRSFCEKHGIQYVHFPTIYDNVVASFEHIRVLGSKPL